MRLRAQANHLGKGYWLKTRKYRSSLRTRIFLVVFLALIPPFALIISNSIEQILVANAATEREALRLLSLAAQSHDRVISANHDLLTLLSRLPAILLNPAACKTLFADFPQRFPDFANIVVIAPQGNVTCSPLPIKKGVNFANRPWFKEVLETRSFTASDYLIGKNSNKPSLVLALPVLNGAANVAAVIAVSIRLSWMNSLSDNEQLPRGSTVTMIDRNGTILGRQPESDKRIGQSHPRTTLIVEMLKHKPERAFEAIGLDGVERFYALKSLGNGHGISNWYLFVGIPKEFLRGPSRSLLLQNLAWMSLAAILVLAVAWIGGQTMILRRIRSLVDASKKLGKGDLATRTGMDHQRDEIGQLAGAFDQMAESLQAREMERQYSEQTMARLAAIVESSNDAIIGRTSDGTITSWNKGAENIYGYSAAEMIGQSTTILIPPDDIDAVRKNYQRIHQGNRIEPYDTVRLRKGGARIAVSVTVSPVKGASGKIIGASSITRDISERKRRENEIKALHDINLAITSTLDLSAILQILLEKIDALLPYEASHIRLLNKSTGNFDKLVYHNIDEAQWKARSDMGGQSIHQSILRSCKPMFACDIQQDERFANADFYTRQGMGSYLGLPLIFNEEIIGTLSLLSREKHQVTDAEMELAETLAKQASIVIHNAQIYEQIKLKSQHVLDSEKQIRTLANGLMHAQDQEAKRIAGVLHDESGQLLAAAYIALDEIAKRVPAIATTWVNNAKTILDQVEQRLRELSHELHPTILDDLGLQPSLDFLIGQISKRTNIKCKFEAYVNERLAPALEITLYRVVQQALNNVVRHAHATEVHIRLVEDEEFVQCSIQDYGIGFNVEEVSKRVRKPGAGLGLNGMQERVETMHGTFRILSAPASGTKLLVTLPKERVNGSQAIAC